MPSVVKQTTLRNDFFSFYFLVKLHSFLKRFELKKYHKHEVANVLITIVFLHIQLPLHERDSFISWKTDKFLIHIRLHAESLNEFRCHTLTS